MKKLTKILLSIFVIAVLSLVSVYAISSNNNDQSSNLYERPCETCYRTGKCRGCNGTGKDKAHTIYGTVIIDCGACKGTGKCQYCGGDGIKGN